MNNPITVLIVDSNLENIDNLTSMIGKYCRELSIAGKAQTFDEGIHLIETLKPDILFINTLINGKIGFELLDIVSGIRPKIIFISSFEKYAINSLKYEPVGFLVNPFDIKELKQSVNRALDKINKDYQEKTQVKDDFLILPVGNKVQLIKSDTIQFCESMGNYTYFYLNDGSKVLATKNLGYYARKLLTYNFIRIHKSYLVNLSYVKYIQKSEKLLCELINGKTLPISRRRQKELLDLLSFLHV